jgi:23S rRNA pseudouridine2605 synthase
MSKHRKTTPDQPTDRLQKILARAGLGSRRGLEKRITAGEIEINGQVAKLGDQVAEGDQIGLDQVRYRVVLDAGEDPRVVLYNKPEGLVCTRSDPDGRPTVFDRLAVVKNQRWVTIGRLDINTTGLLMFTTDGDLAHAMMHPSTGVDREYACRVHGQVTSEMMQRLRDGVELEDGPAHFSDVVDSGGSGENHWFHVALMEGRNREVRRLWAAVGVEVSRLKRVRYGAVFMPSRLKVGRWEEMRPKDVRTLRKDVGLSPRPSGQLSLKRIPGRGRKRH